ncbi:hypothetical protein B0H14DRAFT_3876975 [Mycena olivaceomarginata]|nr:hypothetical protein B0H14DRAFT_3876975 [Mycena olivaceomarginata]
MSMTNGFAGSTSTSSGTQHQLWTPRSRADYQPHTAAAQDDVPASAELLARSEHRAFAVPSRDHASKKLPVGGGLC